MFKIFLVIFLVLFNFSVLNAETIIDGVVSGSGDMSKADYDSDGNLIVDTSDALVTHAASSSNPHTVTANQLSDFDAEVSSSSHATAQSNVHGLSDTSKVVENGATTTLSSGQFIVSDGMNHTPTTAPTSAGQLPQWDGDSWEPVGSVSFTITANPVPVTQNKALTADEFKGQIYEITDGVSLTLPDGAAGLNGFVWGKHPGSYVDLGNDSATFNTTSCASTQAYSNNTDTDTFLKLGFIWSATSGTWLTSGANATCLTP